MDELELTMSALFDKARDMLGNNRRRHVWRWMVSVMAVAVAVASCLALLRPATALTGGTTLSAAITKDSSVFYRSADSREGSWVKASDGQAVDGASNLRLRLVFRLPAGALKDGATLQYKLPGTLSFDTAAGTYDHLAIHPADSVATGDTTGAVTIGSADVADGVLTLTFDDESVTSSAGKEQSEGGEAVPGKELSGFVDLDCGFGNLTTDERGHANIRLSDAVTLSIGKVADDAAPKDDAPDTDTAIADATNDGDGTNTASPDAEGGSADAGSGGTTSPTSPRSTRRNEAMSNANGTDLTQYVSAVEVDKLVNGQWTRATQFTDGESVRVALSYNIPAGVVTETNRVVTYQLPNGLKPDRAQDGRVTQGSKEVGDYTIDTNGMVTITYDQAFAQSGGAIQGTLNFKGIVSNTSGGTSGTINFGGSSKPITVVTPVQDNHDITTKKTGSFSNADRTEASYQITVSTNRGTGEPVSITDRWDRGGSTTGITYAYKQDSLKIVKVSANGAETTIVQGSWNPYHYNVAWTGGQSPQFTVSGLPALNAGEKYVVTYGTSISGATADSGQVANSAGSTSGPHDSWDWHSISWTKDIKKQAMTYDKDRGIVHWRITVNANHKDVSDWRVVDQLPYPMIDHYRVWSDQSDYQAVGGNPGDSRVDFTFPRTGLSDSQKKATYYIDFWAEVRPTNGEMSNTAYLYPPDGHNQSDTGIVNIEHRTWDVSKTFSSETPKGQGIYANTWKTMVTVPEGTLSSFEYVDTIENAVDGDGVDMGSDSHYATAADLEKSLVDDLRLEVDDNNSYVYAGGGRAKLRNGNGSTDTDDLRIVVTYYDANGAEVPATNTTTHVKSFKVNVIPAAGKSITARHLTIDGYDTYTDASKAAEGSTWRIKNKGETKGKVSEATHDHTTPKKFDKQVGTGHKTPEGTDEYGSGNTSVVYDDVNGILTYRLLLNTTKDDEGTIVINDDLPAGQTLDASSIRAVFKDRSDDGNEYHENGGWGDTLTDFDGAQKLSFETSSNPNGTTHLKITIPDYRYSSSRTLIAVFYKVSIVDDPTWLDPKNASKTYTNTAEWNGHPSTTNTKVTHDVKSISKDGVQLDKDGNPVKVDASGNPVTPPSGNIRYYVDINPKADDLDPSSDTLELTDQLSNAAAYNPVLDISKVKLYAYDSSAEHHMGAEIDSSRYTLQYDAPSGKITVTVPDSLACVLTYEYTLDQTFAGNTTISNKASLNGKWSTEEKTVLKDSSSSATAIKKAITIYKVDSDNYKKPLPGTQFKLEYWQNGAWVTKNATLEADQDGKIRWDLAVATPELTTNTLYRLTETKALSGYHLDTTPHYFIWMDDANNADASYNASNAAGAGVNKDNVTMLRDVGGIMYIPNVYTRVTVNKVWANASGAPVNAPANSSVQVQLYRQVKTVDPNDSCTFSVTGKGDEKDPQWRPEVTATEVVKKGTSVTFTLTGYNVMTLEVYVNGAHTQSLTFDGNATPIPVTIDNVTSDTTVVVQNTHDGNNPGVTITDYTKPNNTFAPREKVDGPVMLDAANSWSHDWDGLPATDSSGNTYYYTVEEVGVPSGYTVSYTNNGGIKTGSITVTNSSSGYTLPNSGGTGIAGTTALGIIVLVGALLGLGFMYRCRGRYDQ